MILAKLRKKDPVLYEYIKNDQLDLLKELHLEGKIPLDSNKIHLAILSGKLRLIEFFYEIGCPWDIDVCSYAAEKGYLDCLKYAHEHGCPWNYMVIYSAASSGHLECLQYGIEHGIPLDKYVAIFAAENGQLSCLQYLLMNGCPSDGVFTAAATYAKFECMKWLHEYGLPANKLDLYYDVDLINSVKTERIYWINFEKLSGYPPSKDVDILEFTKCIDYLEKHIHAKGGNCPLCLLKKREYMKIDWNYPDLKKIPEFKKYLNARQKIYMTMERAYLDPEYALCRKRLLRDFAILIEMS